jgi:hypothetical protein
MKPSKIFCFFVVVFLAAFVTRAQQVIVNFNPLISGQSLDGLNFVLLQNSYPHDVLAKMTIRVRESHAGTVVTISVPSFILRPGNSSIDRNAFSRSKFSFANNSYGVALNQSGRFPEGEYEYCFETDLSETKTPLANPFFESCFNHDLQPLTPLLLIHPVDGDEDCNKRPQFIWQAPMPMPAEARFRLVLTEVKEKQDIAEAINFNPPIINQGNIPVNQLNYPFNAPDLQKDKKYVWQVTVYTGKTILKKSEIWTYTVKCDEAIEQKGTDSYREMKENDIDNFYIADKSLRFSFNNPYSAGVLSYSIVSLADPGSPINGLPQLTMTSGLNKFELDLSAIKGFKKGQEYLLTVRLINNRQLKLRFIYKNE